MRRLVTAVLLVATACSGAAGHRTESATHIRDPAKAVDPDPDYTLACAPSGVDSHPTCIEVTLKAVDNARAKEHVKPMALPSTFPRLGAAEQLFIVVNRERVDRGLPPFAGLSAALNQVAQRGADAADLPPDPGDAYLDAATEWLGAVPNGLDAGFYWMYGEGPKWEDRHLLLDDYGRDNLVMGAALNPTADNSPGDQGGPSLAAVFAVAHDPNEPLTYTWAQALADTEKGTVRPQPAPPANASASHIPDPPANVAPNPDFVPSCAPTGLDSSPACVAAALLALNRARAAEGVKPMALPPGFGQLSVADQLFVAINLERVDRGLPPALGRTAALDRNARAGADAADDPPDPGDDYDVSDGLWAGGSSNGLDAVYGFMYDDGPGSTNLDCPAKGGPGCWGHRHGILDAFGTVGTLLMGAAVNPTGDTYPGDEGGTSMGVTLAITTKAPGPLAPTWSQFARE